MNTANLIIRLKEEYNILEGKIDNYPLDFTNPLLANEVYRSHVRRQGEINDTLSTLCEESYEALLTKVEQLKEDIANLPNGGVIRHEQDTNAVTWSEEAEAIFDEIEYINLAIKICSSN